MRRTTEAATHAWHPPDRILLLALRLVMRADGRIPSLVQGLARFRKGQNSQQGVHRFGVEVGARVALEFGNCRLGVAPRAVGTRARDGVERVGHVHDSGGERNLIAAEAERVAAPVWSLMVQFHYRDVGCQERKLAQDMCAYRGVALESARTPPRSAPRAFEGPRR